MDANTALSLIKIYKTRDPFKIAEKMGIKVAHEALGKVKMYYLVVDGVGVIHINDDVPRYAQPYQVALGIYYHLKSAAGFGLHIENAMCEWQKHEKESHIFAITLTVEPSSFLFPTFAEMCSNFGMTPEETKDLSAWLDVILKENGTEWDERPETLQKIINELIRR